MGQVVQTGQMIESSLKEPTCTDVAFEDKGERCSRGSHCAERDRPPRRPFSTAHVEVCSKSTETWYVGQIAELLDTEDDDALHAAVAAIADEPVAPEDYVRTRLKNSIS